LFRNTLGDRRRTTDDGRKTKNEKRKTKDGQAESVSRQSSAVRPQRPIFEDVTVKMGLNGVHGSGYATSAAFGDYDNDGRLDLYVCYYCDWSRERDRPCHDSAGRKEYCTPEL